MYFTVAVLRIVACSCTKLNSVPVPTDHKIHMVRDVEVLRLLAQGTEQVGVAEGSKANAPRCAFDPHVPWYPTALAIVHHVLDAMHITVVTTEVEVPRETPILPETAAMSFLLGLRTSPLYVRRPLNRSPKSSTSWLLITSLSNI